MNAGTHTPGKAHGLTRISDGDGRYAMLAIDQRPPLIDLVARAGRELDEAARDIGVLKGLVADALAASVTGILVDPLYGYAHVLPMLPRSTGLLLTLEDHRFETTSAGHRRSRLIPGWGVEAAVRAGADALKLLIWYRPDAPADVRTAQEVLTRSVGDACARADRPFVLELLPYPLPGETNRDYARRLPELSLGLVEAFAPASFRVDLYKLALPGSPGGVREWGGDLYTLSDLRAAAVRMTRMLPAPWVLLSGGMPPNRFVESLAEATASGARGYLAGRAVWWHALEAYPDTGEVRRRLHDEAPAVLRALNVIVQRLAAARPRGDWGAVSAKTG